MFDCANVEMRELLPDLAAGTLDATTRAHVEHHVASCAECASELETLRLVRSAYAITPAVDVRRVVGALPKVRSTTGAPRGKPIKRWIDWRVAAALTMITVGGLSLAVARRWSGDVAPPDSAAVGSSVDTPRALTPTVAATERPSSVSSDSHRALRSGRPTASSPPKAQLAFTGGTDDLDDASIKALLGALDEMDRAPLAPSEEPDPTPVLPVIKTGVR